MVNEPLILFFVKTPRRGAVKSRLAAALGEDAALELYRCFVLDMLETLDRTGLGVQIAVHPPEDVPVVSSWLGSERRYLPQEGGDLGERMEQAFRGIFSTGTARVLLIGSDIPDLPAEMLGEALRSLDRNDAVIGPAVDGGYYLIGFRSEGFQPSVFRGIAWSSSDVYRRTLQALRGAGSAVRILPAWQDVDTIDDLRSLMVRSRGTAFAGSRTMHYLLEHQDRMNDREGHHGSVRL